MPQAVRLADLRAPTASVGRGDPPPPAWRERVRSRHRWQGRWAGVRRPEGPAGQPEGVSGYEGVSSSRRFGTETP